MLQSQQIRPDKTMVVRAGRRTVLQGGSTDPSESTWATGPAQAPARITPKPRRGFPSPPGGRRDGFRTRTARTQRHTETLRSLRFRAARFGNEQRVEAEQQQQPQTVGRSAERVAFNDDI